MSSRPGTSATRWLGRIAVAALVTVSASLTGTWAAFSSSTSNPGSSVASGTVSLSDDDSATAMFEVTDMRPGDSATKCIEVGYTGLDATVKLYGSIGGTGLAAYLTLKVEKGSGADPGSGHSCVGFSATSTLFDTAAMNTFASTYAGGYDGATFTSGTTAVYRFTVALPADTECTDACSKTASATFTWEARNA